MDTDCPTNTAGTVNTLVIDGVLYVLQVLGTGWYWWILIVLQILWVLWILWVLDGTVCTAGIGYWLVLGDTDNTADTVDTLDTRWYCMYCRYWVLVGTGGY